MKNCIILSVMLLGFWALYAAFHTAPPVGRVADFRRSCGSANIWFDLPCRAYVRGVVEGMAVAVHPRICFPDKFDSRDALPIVRRYLAEHPDLGGLQSAKVVQSAFRQEFPCRSNYDPEPQSSAPARPTDKPVREI